MLIEWYGNSCFRVALENGKKIVFDPFDDKSGYEQPNIETDYVLISHGHHDHNCTDTLKGDFKAIKEVGDYSFEGLAINGYPSFHDRVNGAKRGKNIVFTVKAEGITVCHMGDIGHIPSGELYDQIGHVDILMIPVGGNFTVDASEAIEIVNHLQPNITLPMHYRTMNTDSDIESIYPFLELATGLFDISRNGANTITVTKDHLKKRSRITVLEYTF